VVAGAAAVLALSRPAAASERPLVLDANLGPAFLMKSRSKAIGHAFKPAARLGLRLPWAERFELGGAVSGVVDGSEHYRVLGALAHGRLAVWRTPAFSAGAGLAVGAGYDADILHADLNGGGAVLPYGFLALDARWSVGRRWLVGVEAAWENLSVARLGALLGLRFDGASGALAAARR
jgi:hypothetical protein